MTLDEELARLPIPKLGGTVEGLLRAFATREQSRRAAVAELIDGFNAFHQENGLLSDEFSSFQIRAMRLPLLVGFNAICCRSLTGRGWLHAGGGSRTWHRLQGCAGSSAASGLTT